VRRARQNQTPTGCKRYAPSRCAARPNRWVAIVVHETYLSSVRAWLLLFALLYVTPLSLAAQIDAAARPDRRTPRRTVLTVVGAVAGGASGLFFDRRSSGNGCRGCYIGGGALIGAVAGLLIGRELDQMYAVRYRGAPRLRIPFLEQALDGDPLALAARDTLLAVATSTGVTILSSTHILRPRARRASAIRGISALDLTSRTQALAVATPTGLYLYPPIRGAGVLLREGTIQAASAADDRLFFSIGPRIEWAAAHPDSVRPWPGLDAHAAVVDLEWDGRRQILWALSDTSLLALQWEGDTLRMASRTHVDAGGRSLTTDGNRLAVTLGGDGIALFDISSHTAPQEIARWTGARFVYEASLAGDRLYAAAGPEGVFVIDVSTVPLHTIGLAFDLGFATTLLSRDGYTYILDRRTSSVRRISTPTTR
jgi:hypothetical protein